MHDEKGSQEHEPPSGPRSRREQDSIRMSTLRWALWRFPCKACIYPWQPLSSGSANYDARQATHHRGISQFVVKHKLTLLSFTNSLNMPMAFEPPPTHAITMSGAPPHFSRHCTRVSRPITDWNSRTCGKQKRRKSHRRKEFRKDDLAIAGICCAQCTPCAQCTAQASSQGKL